MPILTSLHTDAPTQLDTKLTLGLVALLVLVVVIAVIRKAIANKKAANVGGGALDAPESLSPAEEIPLAPGSAGDIKLHNVAPKTAAMLMAIVADKLGKPLNELRFISIKEVE